MHRLFRVLVSVCVLGLSVTAARADDSTRIAFDSFTPKSLFDLARERRAQWVPAPVWGDLSLPAGVAGPVPAIVLAHGSDGVGPGLQQWVQAFNGIGVATFIVDSFAPRAVSSTAADQTSVPAAANVMDAFQALRLLSADPRIDARRIGVMGFSRGGTVALQTAQLPFLRAVVKTGQAFALHIATYAGCSQIYTSPNLTRAPLLNLVGAADDYTHPEPCEALAAEYATLGTPVETHRYADAHHAWDSLLPVRYRADATSGYACGVIRTDIPTWVVTSERTGQVIPSDQLTAFINACMTRGAHVGRNEAAFQASREDATRFVRRVFFGQ